MELENQLPQTSKTEGELPRQFISQAGMTVLTADDQWILAPNTKKGYRVDVAWLHQFAEGSGLRYALLDSLIHYAETKSCGTVVTIAISVANSFPQDNDDEIEFYRTWCEMGDAAKKTLKGFLTTCVEILMHKNLQKHHQIAQKFNYKQEFKALHPTKGRLTDYEYDSILHNVRSKCEDIFIARPTDIEFYTMQGSSKGTTRFIDLRGVLAYRLMLQMARRPAQIAMIKWCDILPMGHSFSNEIDSPIYTGARELHVRCFRIKHSNQDNSWRLTPEKYSIPLSEHFSSILLKYRELYVQGLEMALKSSGVEPAPEVIDSLIWGCPVVPRLDLFSVDWSHAEVVSQLKSPKSMAFHVSETQIKGYSNYHGVGSSERAEKVVGNNNRLRHTWLCNAAMSGRSLSEISRITNVTLPAARAYLQLGLTERQFIDENYAANNLLRAAFSPKPFIGQGDQVIESEVGCSVGVEKGAGACETCEHKRRMVRPIPCYGCPDFRPLLEADHESVLLQALAKRDFIKNFGSSESYAGSTKRLDKAIAYIKMTITVCNEILLSRKGLKGKL